MKSLFARIFLALLLGSTFLGWSNPSLADEAKPVSPEMGVEVNEQGATITIDGKLFTRYLACSENKPILWPVIGPTGEAVTRAYPMEKAGPGERSDHPHHRSVWFGYEGINGGNFWAESKSFSGKPKPTGKQVATELVSADCEDNIVTLVTRDDYQNVDGKVVAKDERTYQFGVDGETRWIDVAIILWSPEGPLVISDTKEGAFGVRVAGTMKINAKKGGKIVSSNGDVNKKAWGKPAAWVDYHGPVKGETVGIAILAHPTSHSATPRWHVRSYGLFVANPFGAADYTGGKVKGGLTVAEGESLFIRHRILIHRGDPLQANIAEAYEKYSKTN